MTNASDLEMNTKGRDHNWTSASGQNGTDY